MRNRISPFVCSAAGVAVFVLAATTPFPAAPGPEPGQTPPPQSQPPQQQSEIVLSLSGEPGARPRYAVPDFIARSADVETADAAKLLGSVLWDDLAFEREFYMVPRDTYKSISTATSMETIPFERWRELGADALVMGSVEKSGPTSFRVEVKLFDVRTGRSAMAREYTGTLSNPRLYAHWAADEIHQAQRALRGAARTKLAFSSDRDGERMAGTVQQRGVKEIYISDYDGANQRRVTTTKTLNLFPTWSPDARTIAYTSYRTGFPDIYLSLIYQGVFVNPTGGKGQNRLSAWSPDGNQLCFSSSRDGNEELYVVGRDGSNLRRLTNNPAIDTTPTWSPNGTQIAFTSDRGGTPQIYVIDVDGLNVRKLTNESYCDRPTWSPAPFNEIAYASRTGSGYDIKVYTLATQEVRQLTSSEGSNESPSYAPNGRHLAFSSTRSGKRQIYTIGRDGPGSRVAGTEIEAMRNRWVWRGGWLVAVTLAVVLSGACKKKQPPVARPIQPLATLTEPEVVPPPPPPPAPTPVSVAELPMVAPKMPDDPMASRSVDDLNRESPLQPAFFDYDSAELNAAARAVLDANATLLRRYPAWSMTVEGHCDERGTAEYNSALAERRAAAARTYLVSLGIPAERLHIVSYGKEFPFDPAHNEAAWAKNRRAHFVITSK
jgi:TolB protein